MPNQPEEILRKIGPLKIDLLKEKNETGTLDNLGQPNIIDYMNKEPFLTSLSDRGLGGGQPGTILPNNEPSSRSPKPTDGFRPGGEFDKSSGVGAVGDDLTQPGITTGAPTSKPEILPTELEENFDPVNNTWPPGEQNPDHGCDCQMGKDNSTEYSSQGITTIHQATPDFTPEESAMDPKMNPDNTDRNIVLRGSQAFSDNNETMETRDGDAIAQKIKVSPLWKEKGDGIGEEKDQPRTINLKVEIIKEEPIGESFEIDEPIVEWKEANLPREDEFTEPSTVVGTVKYFPDEQVMEVELNGRKYPYYGVSYRDFDSFRGAGSKGAHYNRIFKGRFGPGRKVDALSNQEALNKAILYRESMVREHPDDFSWIDELAIKEMIQESKRGGQGKYILLKAAEGTTTDHRAEGESYQRIITPELLKKLTYTAIKKGSDINHLYPKRNINSGVVIDAEFNDKTGFAEFIYFETDPEIIQGITDGYIDAVSINGGAARSYKIIDGGGLEVENPDIRCTTGECFRLGEGIILGEKDNVAFTWVVTQPGFRYNGRMIPPTVPGVKTTRIIMLE